MPKGYLPSMIDKHLRLYRKGTKTLVISADRDLCTKLAQLLAAIGCRSDEVLRPAGALQHLAHLSTDAVLLDIEAGDDEAWEAEYRTLLSHDVVRAGVIPVVVFANAGGLAAAARMIQLGASDYVSRLSTDEQIAERVVLALSGRSGSMASFAKLGGPALKQQVTTAKGSVNGHSPGLLLGQSDAIQEVLARIEMVADKQTTVLIMGETGTGKERVARAIHAQGPNSAREMVSVNCAGIPSNLLEDEFFGHIKGAFTDAHQIRIGRFEQAAESSIFLDEIGDLPLELQPKLLRVLQEREIYRIGGADTIRVNARVIAATNTDLWAGVGDGSFREDLFYRINVFPIQLPALRDRSEDIPLFLDHFLERFCRRDSLPPKMIHPAAEAELTARSWPGNIRELENAVEMAVILSKERQELDLNDFPRQRRPAAREPIERMPMARELGYKTLVEQFERDLISRVLQRTSGNKTLAAEMLRLKRTTLVEKWKKLQQDTSVHAEAS
ncbi:MAG: sigma-54 dependent transcriptional regulator [Acidobacteria bacterium]|nr:sigma-54 dependent transcriptional regulator [Acidobacteriota bacterium]